MERETEKQEKIDWVNRGYTKAIQEVTGSLSMVDNYPHRDRYSEEDEKNFLHGYAYGKHDLAETGIHPVMAYAQEKVR